MVQIEAISRQGGKDVLPLMVYTGLSYFSDRKFVGSNGNQSLWLVITERYETVRDVLSLLGVEARSLDCSKVFAAIVQSYPSRKKDLYILCDRRQRVFIDIGLGCDDDIVISTQSQRLKIALDFLPQLAKSGLLSQCTSLLVDLATRCNPPIHKMIESGAIPAMLNTLSEDNMSLVVKLLNSRRSLLDEVIQAGFNLDSSKLLPVLSSDDDSFVKFFSPVLSNLINSSPNATWDSIIPTSVRSDQVRAQSIKETRDRHTKNGTLTAIKMDNTVRLNSVSLYTMSFQGPRCGFNMLFFNGRAAISDPFYSGTKICALIAALGSNVLDRMPFKDIQAMMSHEITHCPHSTITFAQDPEFISFFTEEMIPLWEAKVRKREQEGS
jgi:hypothetical protein